MEETNSKITILFTDNEEDLARFFNDIIKLYNDAKPLEKLAATNHLINLKKEIIYQEEEVDGVCKSLLSSLKDYLVRLLKHDYEAIKTSEGLVSVPINRFVTDDTGKNKTLVDGFIGHLDFLYRASTDSSYLAENEPDAINNEIVALNESLKPEYTISEIWRVEFQDYLNLLLERQFLIKQLRIIRFLIKSIIKKRDFNQKLPLSPKYEIKIISETDGVSIKLGRKPRQEVPQTEIVDYLKEKLQDGNRRFVHDTGKYIGKPNWRQLALGYLSSNPSLEESGVFGQRALENRFKKAYEQIDSSAK